MQSPASGQRSSSEFGNSARLKSILAGDADFYTAAADQELQPLFESGDVQALYTIVGEQFPPQVDRSRTLESFLVPGAPQAVVDYIKSARGMGRAFFAPPGVNSRRRRGVARGVSRGSGRP